MILQDKMRGVICVLLTIFCVSGAQNKTCPLPSSNLTLYASEDWQDIKSPNYGVSNYDDNTLCEWTIQSQDPSKRIVLVVDSLDLETDSSSGCYDYIQISDDYNVSEKYCRPDVPPITSGGQTLYVRFTTDGSNTRSGFHLRYGLINATEITDSLVPIQTCRSGGMTLQAESYAKYIKSLNYPANYLDLTDCQWTIQTLTANYVVKIVVEDSDLEFNFDCSYDYLVAYDGSGTSDTQLDKLCGTTKPTIYSTGSSLTLKFHSDSSTSGRGFKLSYQEVPDPAQCSSPPASAPPTPMGFSYPQSYAPVGYPAQVPTSTAGSADYNRQESLPSEPPPPYWMADQYEVQPAQQPTLDTSGAGGQSQPSSAAAASSTATVPAPGADTQQRAQGSAPPAAPRSGQAAPGGSDNRAFCSR